MSDKNIDLFHDIQILEIVYIIFIIMEILLVFLLLKFFWTNIVIVWVLSFELIIIYNSKLFICRLSGPHAPLQRKSETTN